MELYNSLVNWCRSNKKIVPFLATILFVLTVYAGQNIDNIRINSNTISSINANGNIVLDPNGSGGVVLTDQTATTVPYLDANKKIISSSITPTELGYLTGTTANISNVFTGDSGSGGVKGLVPAPAAGDATKFLRGDATWQTASGGQGVPNNITNYNFETNTTGWSTYADAAATTPADGLGGSPINVTIARSTTTPLRDTADLNFVKDAANRQGEGVSYDFTINSADKGRVLSIAFDYEVVSGTYASGDVTVYVYDTVNAVLLPQPSANSIINTGIPAQQPLTTFQTAINSTSYRLIFHVASTSASAYTLAFDNIIVGPQSTASGSVDTDWAAYTPTFTGFGTPSNVNFKWRRRGPDLLIRGNFNGGTPTGVEARISFPSGFVAASTISSLEFAGDFGRAAFASTFFFTYMLREPSVTYFTISRQSSSSHALSKQTGDNLLGSGELASIEASVPIAGWGSNNVLSTSANNRIVVARLSGNPAATTSGNPVIFPTIDFDTTASYNASTGRYTAPVPGYYKVYGYADASTANTVFGIYVNGVGILNIGESDGGSGDFSFIGSVRVNAGDIIDLRPNANTDIGATNSWMHIELLSGPQQIAASEDIYFEANTSTTAGNTSTPFIFTNVVNNSHNSYSASTGVFTAPAPGVYQFNAAVISSSGTNNISIYKNGSLKYYGKGITTTDPGNISVAMQLTSGDTVDIRPAGAVTALSSATFNYFTGFRTGR